MSFDPSDLIPKRQKKKKFQEKDIPLNPMFSKPGKASENMHLSLASLAKLKKRAEGYVYQRKGQVQGQQAEVSRDS